MVYCPGDVHWARLEASALGSLIAACPAWKWREEKGGHIEQRFDLCFRYCRYAIEIFSVLVLYML